MCGIVGCFSANNKIDISLFEKMVDILAHRGPDDRGIYCRDNIAFGHRRLSILDLSERGHQPMFYKNRYIIVYNGEIYNYKELKDILCHFGYTFSTDTDTEVIMAAYDKWGTDCLSHFNGMWAFAIYDQKVQTLFCARDRYGVKPFYYYKDDDRLVFASEIKAILPSLKTNPSANIPRLLDNVMYGAFDHTEETMFLGIKQIEPGYYLTINNKMDIQKYQYYNLSDIKRMSSEYSENVQKFKDLFVDSVSLRLRSDVPVGSCLSGGLDSSSIVCVMNNLLQKRGQGSIRCVSSCYKSKEEHAYDEQYYIDKVIEQTHVKLNKIYPSIEEYFDQLDKILYHQDEPVGGLAHVAQYNVFKSAKELGLSVMLDGQGADEQLAGYSSFYSIIIREYMRSGDFYQAYKEYNAYKKLRSVSDAYGVKGLIWFMIKDKLPNVAQRFLLNRYVNREEFKWLNVPYDNTEVRRIRTYSDFDDFSRKSMRYGLATLLHYEDRNSMASSVEGRVPFLDYRLVEHVLSLPPEQKISKGVTKRILRDALKDILPEEIRTRISKLGFAVPSDLWIMKYPDFFEKELDTALSILSPLFDKEKVLSWLEYNKENKIALTNTILWRLICVGRWVKIFNVTIPNV